MVLTFSAGVDKSANNDDDNIKAMKIKKLNKRIKRR